MNKLFEINLGCVGMVMIFGWVCTLIYIFKLVWMYFDL